MRERWSDDEVRRRSPIDRRELTRSEAKNVRVGLLERSKRLAQSAATGASRRTTTGRAELEGGTLRLAATTGWRPRGVNGNCVEAGSSVWGTRERRSVGQFVEEGVKLIVRYTRQLIAQLAFFRRHQNPGEDAIRQSKPAPFGHQRHGCNLV